MVPVGTEEGVPESRATVAAPMSSGVVPRELSNLNRMVLPETEGLRAMRMVWSLKFPPW